MKFISLTLRSRIHLKNLVFFIFLLPAIPYQIQAQQTIIQYLSGTDKDHTVPY